jgi:hypothetical protein
LLAHLPEQLLLAVVDLPRPLQQGGDDVLVLLHALEVDAASEREVVDVVGEGLHVVERDLRFSSLAAVSPVVAQVVCEVLGIAVEARAVNFKLLVGQFDQAERRDRHSEV